jgi:hypothetical protein
MRRFLCCAVLQPCDMQPMFVRAWPNCSRGTSVALAEQLRSRGTSNTLDRDGSNLTHKLVLVAPDVARACRGEALLAGFLRPLPRPDFTTGVAR